MFDASLRPVKQRVLAPLVGPLTALPPLGLTSGGLVLGLLSGLAAADSRWLLALFLFIANRLVDGLDGEVARARSGATDRGGYADIVADTVVYAAIPLGAAAGSNLEHIWPIAAVLIASFYVNTTTWMYLAALTEKHRHQEVPTTTSTVMPPGLIEGAETVVFFVAMLAAPMWLDWTMGFMAVTVMLGAGVRFVGGHRGLADDSIDEDRVRA